MADLVISRDAQSPICRISYTYVAKCAYIGSDFENLESYGGYHNTNLVRHRIFSSDQKRCNREVQEFQYQSTRGVFATDKAK